MGIAIDPEDLRKKYVKKMEFWGGKAVVTDIESMKVIPPYCEANSFLAEGAKSENNQLLMSDLIFEHTGDRGIHAIDRVGIEGFFTRDILGKEAEAICDSVRGSGVNTPGETKGCCDLAKVLPTPYETALIVYEEGTEKKRKVHDNAVVVKLPFYSHKLY